MFFLTPYTFSFSLLVRIVFYKLMRGLEGQVVQGFNIYAITGSIMFWWYNTVQRSATGVLILWYGQPHHFRAIYLLILILISHLRRKLRFQIPAWILRPHPRRQFQIPMRFFVHYWNDSFIFVQIPSTSSGLDCVDQVNLRAGMSDCARYQHPCHTRQCQRYHTLMTE